MLGVTTLGKSTHPTIWSDPFLKGARLIEGCPHPFPGDRTMNILVVEDHQDTRRVLSTLLGRSGHEILTATGVRDAIKVLENVRVNVLLSDLGLPDGDGLELVAKAKVIQPRIRAIALTARSSANDLDRGKEAGFDHYLTKPFDYHELRTILAVVRETEG